MNWHGAWPNQWYGWTTLGILIALFLLAVTLIGWWARMDQRRSARKEKVILARREARLIELFNVQVIPSMVADKMLDGPRVLKFPVRR